MNPNSIVDKNKFLVGFGHGLRPNFENTELLVIFNKDYKPHKTFIINNLKIDFKT